MTMVCRVLIAGIGNIFLGDDAFGVQVVRRLAEIRLPANVEVRDFGICGFDLAMALGQGYTAAVLVDAMCRGGPPGTVYVIEPELDSGEEKEVEFLSAHILDPVQALRLARFMGGPLPRVRVVGCEPATFGSETEGAIGLSESVAAAVEHAVGVVLSLIEEWIDSSEKIQS